MENFVKKQLDNEERFAWSITGGLHLILLVFALFYYVSFENVNRPAYMEVTLGEFQSGSPAEYAEEQEEEVATRPNPAEEIPEEPEPEVTQPTEPPAEPQEEATKAVDLAEQTEEIPEDETIQTPETDVVNPEAEETPVELEEVDVPPQTQEEEEVQEGVAESGDERGTEGDANVEQGTGTTQERSAPYDLQWEGELDRTPMVQPLPSNPTNEEATITIRFEVNPDGSLGRVFPSRKMNPELEREVMRTLRSWRFSRLPSGVPQEPQWGTITFRFVLD
ncbi:MAG: TonB family protein [Bacteroidetes bacterium]|jgi:TonB family protein|nr:TonB family protein [Bacteroidota bacterium]